MPPPASPTLAERFAGILRQLCRIVAESHGVGLLLGPQITLICIRLTRTSHRFARIAERLAAGTLRPPRKRKRKPASPEAPPPAPRQPDPLPRGRAWLLKAVRKTTVGGSLLTHMLTHDAEMIALLDAAPQAKRLIRPLFRMLGWPLPDILRLPPRTPAKRRPRAGRPPPAHRPAVRDPAPPLAPPTARRCRPPAKSA